MDLFSDATRRDPFAAYAHLRAHSPVLEVPSFGFWLIFDFEGVKRRAGLHLDGWHDMHLHARINDD